MIGELFLVRMVVMEKGSLEEKVGYIIQGRPSTGYYSILYKSSVTWTSVECYRIQPRNFTVTIMVLLILQKHRITHMYETVNLLHNMRN
jgi:hypothetical protein